MKTLNVFQSESSGENFTGQRLLGLEDVSGGWVGL